MASSHGSKATVFANGYELSTYLSSLTAAGNRDSSEASTFGVSSKQYVPGLKDSTFTAEGFYDGSVGAVDEILSASLITTPTGVITYCPYGDNVTNDICYNMVSIQSTYEITTDVGDVAQISAEFAAGQSTRGYQRGWVAHIMQAEVAGGNTTSQDFGSVSSTNGYGLVVHVSAAATLSIQLQDSADNTTFAAVGSPIAVASGRAAVRQEMVGTLRRYTRVLWTGTGTFLASVERY